MENFAQIGKKVFVLGICYLAVAIMLRKQFRKALFFIALAGALYPLGLTFKFFVFGPRLVRFYVADVGFVPMLTMLFLSVVYLMSVGGYFFTGKIATFPPDKAVMISMINMALVMAFVAEFLQFVIANVAVTLGANNEFLFAGDVLDLGMYLIGYFFCRFILSQYMPNQEVPPKQRPSKRRTRKKRKKRRK